MPSPPITIDSHTAVSAAPFDWSQFLIDLRGKHDSPEGVLVKGAVGGAEFNVNIAFGSYKGVIQAARSGAASVRRTLSLWHAMTYIMIMHDMSWHSELTSIMRGHEYIYISLPFAVFTIISVMVIVVYLWKWLLWLWLELFRFSVIVMPCTCTCECESLSYWSF